MSDKVERGREQEAFRRIDAAFRVGDFEDLRTALGDPAGFPDVTGPITIGHCLEYAIYHSPLSFVRLLLHWAAGAGDERAVGLLLAHGADVTARTRIDECETPREVAQRVGHRALAEMLVPHAARRDE